MELNTRLRRLQIESGRSARQVSAALEFSPNFWSALVNNKNVISREKLAQAAGVFDLPSSELDELEQLRQVARQPRWWDEYASLVPESVLEFIGLENGASKIRNYEALLVTGLLQTEDYANAIFRTNPAVSTVSLVRRWSLRKMRQRRLLGPDAPSLLALMSEAAVRQHYGERSILLDQLRYLAQTVAERPEVVEIRILPFEANPMGLTGASTIYLLDYSSVAMPQLAWRESVTAGGFSPPEETAEIRISFEQALERSSLGPSDSIELIESQIRALE